MKFIQLKNLQPRMELARDLHLFEAASNKVKLLRKGVTLTSDYIFKLRQMGITGAFIRDGVGDDLEMKTLMKDDEKIRTIFEIKQIFDGCFDGDSEVTSQDIDKLADVSDSLVESIENNDTLRISIGNLKSYDEYTYHHSLSVAVLAISIGTAMHLSSQKLKKLGVTALLHDIGKTDISIDIINKPSRLTDDEFSTVKTHSLRGGDYLMARNLIDREIYEGIISHHERWDGKGYPFGLAKKEIPLFSRIISVADVYDALTSNRPYRVPNNPNEALEYIMGGVETMFDFDVVSAFLKRVEPYPIGSCVRLSNGMVGYIINTDDDVSTRPTVKSMDGKYIFDLDKDKSLINLTILGCYGEYAVEVVES